MIALAISMLLLAGTTTAPLDSVTALLAAGDFQSADRVARAALDEAELDPGPDSLRIAEAIEALLRVDLRQSRSGPAEIARARRAVSIRERAFGPTDPRTAVALNSLAAMLWSAAQYEEARATAERALQLVEVAPAPDPRERMRSLAVLANVELSAGDPERAIERWTEVHELRASLSGAQSAEAAQALHSLAIAYRNAGRSVDALATHQQALAIRERVLGPEHLDVAWTLLNLANVYFDLGDFEESERLNRRALEIREKQLGPDHVQVALSRMNLGNAIERAGRPAEAVPLHESALSIYESVYGAWHRSVAQSLNNLALARVGLGEYDVARPLYERSIAIRDSLLGPGSEEAARTRLRLGMLELFAGAPQAAEPILREAVEANRAQLGPDHPFAQDAAIALAEALALLGRDAEALDLSLDAERATIQHLRLTAQGLDEAQSLTYAGTRSSGLDVALTLVAAAPRDTARVIRVWDALARSRSVVLDEMVSRRHWASASADFTTQELHAKVAAARDELARVAIRAHASGAATSEPLDAALREKKNAEQALAAHSRRFRGELSGAGATFAEIAAAVPPHSGVVTFARYRDLSRGGTDTIIAWIAFVLSPDQTSPEAVPLGTAREIDAAMLAWSDAIRTAPDPLRRARDEAACESLGRALRGRIWDPLAARLEGAERVFVVSEGLFQVIPLSALPDARGRALVESGPLIHLLATERDLLAEKSARSEGHGLLAIGGPAFDVDFGKTTQTPAASMPAASAPTSSDACAMLAGGRFNPLPGAGAEVSEVAATWNAAAAVRGAPSEDRALVLTGAGATERALRESAKGRRALHIASHGFFLPEHCAFARGGSENGALAHPLLRGGIALAGANRRAASPRAEDDGILTAEEVAGLDLESLEWVVLSACETGLGEVDLNEGVMGLRRAFRAAGSRALVMSLWRVDDEAAREWMRALYDARFADSLEPADAARAATRSVLRTRRAEGRSTHPYSWASFIVESGLRESPLDSSESLTGR